MHLSFYNKPLCHTLLNVRQFSKSKVTGLHNEGVHSLSIFIKSFD